MSKSDEIEDSSAPLIEHLAELRTRLIRSVLAFIVGMIISFTVWNPLFNFLTLPFVRCAGRARPILRSSIHCT